MAILKSLLLLRRACSSSSLLIRGAIGSLPSSLHNRLSSSPFHPFSANSPWPETPHRSPPAADRKPEISFPEDLPSDYIKVHRGEECMSLTRKTKDEINVKTHDAEQDNLSVSGDSNVLRDASFSWLGDIDDELMVVDNKIVFVGKLKLKRKLGEGEGEGNGDEGGGDGGDHGRSIWMSLKGFFKKRGI